MCVKYYSLEIGQRFNEKWSSFGPQCTVSLSEAV